MIYITDLFEKKKITFYLYVTPYEGPINLITFPMENNNQARKRQVMLMHYENTLHSELCLHHHENKSITKSKFTSILSAFASLMPFIERRLFFGA